MLLWNYGNCESEFRCAGPINAGSGFKFWIADADGFLRTSALGLNRTSRLGPGGLFGGLVTEDHPDFKMLLADHIYRHFFNNGALTPSANDARLVARCRKSATACSRSAPAVLLATDAALAAHLVERTILVVGTDAILPHAVAHNCGTRPLVTWARLAGVPRWVLATRDKIYPLQLAPVFANPERPASEILQSPPESLRVENGAFDLSAREVWTEILVGARPLVEAEANGDHALAQGLLPLLQPGPSGA